MTMFLVCGRSLPWLAAVSVVLSVSVQAEPLLPFRNPDVPMDQRVDDLIRRMTVDEKISQTMMDSPAIERLGIERYHWWNEALHGVARSGTATVFPQAIGLAAAWDPELHQRIADTISTEARAKNNEVLAAGNGTKKYQGLTIWSPNINIFRDPRWGRGQETYGEDPFLTGELAVAFVKGLQGDDPNYLKTVATVKHFAVHSGPEPLRHGFNAVSSERDLWETYLPAFERGIVDGGAMSLMSCYNAVNGIPGPAQERLLQTILRERWGFKGAVVGDVDNVADMWRPKCHLYSPTPEAASATAIKAGNDLCSGKTYEALAKALDEGLVSEADIDKALRRLFALRFKLGEFDPAERVPYRSIPASANASEANDALALEAASESLVLLKNDGSLPWNGKTLGKVAILGPGGKEEAALLGNYSGTPPVSITLAEGLKKRLGAMGAEVVYEPGVPLVDGFQINCNPFPKGVLFTDSSRTASGLKGEIFAHDEMNWRNPEMKGERVGERVDQQFDLEWNEAQPIEGIPIRKATVRWSGVLVPPASGEYTFGVSVEGSVRVILDGKAIIDSWKGQGDRTISSLLKLEAGRAYDIQLEYAQSYHDNGRIQLGWIMPGEDDMFERAMTAAKAADRIVLTLGLTPDLEGESMTVNAAGFDGGDRTSIELPASQRKLLDAVAKLNKPTVIVLTTGSAISFDDSKANAVLLAWYYGQRGADAVADTLLGINNPAGRLPITFYKTLDGLPDFKDYSMENRTYKYYTGTPLYAFGHGLSYTTFGYEKMELSSASAKVGETVAVNVTVKNSGDRDGDEVVQVYATELHPSVPMPLKTLVGFKRVAFKAGEVKTVSIEVPVERLRRWDEEGRRYVVDPGQWKIAAGPSSDQLVLHAALSVIR